MEDVLDIKDDSVFKMNDKKMRKIYMTEIK